jgi:uncharacterized membrane protein YgcG
MNVAKLFGAAAILALAASPAKADHQWASYHWANSGNGVTLTLRHTLRNSAWLTYYSAARADWDQNTPLTLNDGGAYSGTTSKKCSPISGGVLVCSDAYGFRGWLGIATIWANGDHITQATTKLNDSYYGTATYNTPGWRDLVMCQEVGHDFGLDHQDEQFDNGNLGTCMDYTNAPEGGVVGNFNYGPANRSPNAHDYAMLNSNSMYGSGHSDSGGGGGGGGGGRPGAAADGFTFREVGKSLGGGSAVQDSGQWGQAVSRDGQGRPNKFVLDLGGGKRKVTHVFWVPGFRPQAEHLHD